MQKFTTMFINKYTLRSFTRKISQFCLPYLVLSIIVPLIGISNTFAAVTATNIYFDEGAESTLILGNANFQLSLNKFNGSITDLAEKTSKSSLTLGSKHGCLWGAIFNSPNTNYVGGCSFSPTWGNRFSYKWDGSNNILTLNYLGDNSSTQRVDAEISITVSNSNYFDLKLTIINYWGSLLTGVNFPSELLFSSNNVQAGFGPFISPGVRLKPGFFTGFLPVAKQFTTTYPGFAAFADYLALDIAGGHFALYSLNPDGPVQAASFGFVDNSASQAGTFYTMHTFKTYVPAGNSYTSPVVRIRVGQDVKTSVLGYRADNMISAYPNIQNKLGSRFETMAKSPLINADIWKINKPFSAWGNDLDRLPKPSLIQPVSFEAGGFDRSYPDFLPPEEKWGTTNDFSSMITTAHSKNLSVMPYTNQTWWNNDAPTVTSLLAPLTAANIAVLDQSGQSVSETYNGHTGYVVSPFSPLVQKRLAALMRQFQTDVPVDYVFQDQIGARNWLPDYNPAAPNPMAYSDGWLAYTDSYADQGLMTEMGWDRLAKRTLGFHGSLLTWQRLFNWADQSFGNSNWEAYPLALWLFHDKVLFYQHNLAPATFSTDKEVITWNMAFGTMLSFDWVNGTTSTLDSPWLKLTGALQSTVGARYAGRTLDDFSNLTADVTRSTFGDLTITANWNKLAPYIDGNNSLASGGFSARTNDNTLEAGIFSGIYNGSTLTNGEHYLVIARSLQKVTVSQPVGSDSLLAVNPPPGWQPRSKLAVWAVDAKGNQLGTVSFNTNGGKVNFTYGTSYKNLPVDHYEVIMK